MVIYADVFFLVNFICDFFIISLTFDNIKFKIIKRISASFFGSVYAMICIYFPDSIISSFTAKIAVLVIMMFIAHFPISPKALITRTFEALLYSSVFCGIFYSIQLFFNNVSVMGNSFITISLFLSCYVIIRVSSNHFKEKTLNKTYSIQIFQNNNSVSLEGIYDSGNSLMYKNKAVIIVSPEQIEKLFGSEVNQFNIMEFVEKEKCFIVPYETVGNNGILVGFQPDKILINNIEKNDLIVCISKSDIKNTCILNKSIR